MLPILVISMAIERLWEHLQQLTGDRLSPNFKIIGSGILACAAALTLQLDLLHLLEVMPAPTYPGYILTGLVLGLGSNVVHDITDFIHGYKRPGIKQEVDHVR